MYNKNGAKVSWRIKMVIRNRFCYWDYIFLLNIIIIIYFIIIIVYDVYYTIYFSLFSLIVF